MTNWYMTYKDNKCQAICIPTVIINNQSMDSTEKLIFGVLYSRYCIETYFNDHSLYHINVSSLANIVNTTPKDASLYLIHLAKDGWIGLDIYGKSKYLTEINNKRCFNSVPDKDK